MDAIELARQHAARLHDAVVADGTDAWNPLAVATAVAKAKELDVEPIEPGSPLLSDGRAHFDPTARAIRHEDCGDDFHKAFLISHELGHASLGDDRVEHTAHKIDPARSSEAAPVGEDRVTDYSRRQRREVQMDLFGRELLLPRHRVRALHLDGMTATQIAERLGAPFEVVAQQLLDALLLPPIAHEEPALAPAPVRQLNNEQRAAASYRGPAYLLEAGPGTGKTQTLVERVTLLVDEGVDPRSILVLTFSNKAAGELSDRIASLRPEAASAMWIGTFHAFGLDLVRRRHRDLGYDREPRLMDRSEAIALLEHEYLSLGLVHHQELWDPARPLKDMLSAISRAKDEVADATRFADLSRLMLDAATTVEEREAAERCGEVALVYERYEQLKRCAVAIDFGDLVALPVTLLESMPSIAQELRGIHQHVLVDEYQDVNRSSVRLLQLLTDGGRDLWAVGDARQAIYRFRGASSYNMSRFAEDFPGAQGGRLRVNYRSTPEIVASFSAFGQDMAAGTGDASLEANRPRSGSRPDHVTFGDNDDEADALADEILALKPSIGFRGQAVLCPGNDRLARLGGELERRGIPVLYLGNLFDRPEVKDLLALLSLLVDRRAMALVRHPTLPGLDARLGLTGAAAVVEHLRQSDVAPLAWTSRPSEITGVTDEDAAVLSDLAVVLTGFSEESRPWPVLARVLLDRTRAAALLSEADDVAGRSMGVAVWQFMGFLRAARPGQGLPIQNLLDSIRRLVMLADERDLRQLPIAAQGIDAVRLMTIHGSKGLEFPAVHVMGLNKNSMPRAARRPACPVPDGMIDGAEGGTVAIAKADHELEQECLFYVAASRARDRLLVYSATKDAGGRNRNPSPYVARLAPITQRSATKHVDRQPDPELLPLPIRVGPPLVLTTAQLDLYTRCPRRFLYTHVLGTGGKRTPTTLSRMHDIVRAVVNDMARIEPDACTQMEAEEMLAAAWSISPLAGEEYRLHREAALLLVQRFASSRAGGRRVEIEAFQAVIRDDVVTARADDVIVGSDGRHMARVVRTGHASSSAGQGLADAAFQMAAASMPHCGIEILHLSDAGPAIAVAFDANKLGKQREKLVTALAEISAGRFAPERSERTCPFCPAFYTCGPIACGSLQKNL
ncbi:ATP-dependent helicase [Sphingomonas cavernae]|uniref:DNA 3'-5' helicase n=1 Tax=Sphingomonas cavernae TaxID=2320861 RepID=A0A418WK41_9SPHN|nr:ATP-dependent helicase [Sphingomonas cavernae]RJF90312.1 ImmA/IrrE family metallo-endopeptidase [Sphingomonas cavernae]